MAALLTSQTAETTGTLTSHSGPCSIFVTGTMDGARVTIKASATTNTSDMVKLVAGTLNFGRFDGVTGAISCDLQGTYYLAAVLEDVGASTSVTVTTTQ